VDIALVEPDVVPTPLQVGAYAVYQFRVSVVPVAEEDAHRPGWLVWLNLAMLWANPKLADLRQRRRARRALIEVVIHSSFSRWIFIPLGCKQRRFALIGRFYSLVPGFCGKQWNS
jgi:hypothetical protein